MVQLSEQWRHDPTLKPVVDLILRNASASLNRDPEHYRLIVAGGRSALGELFSKNPHDPSYYMALRQLQQQSAR